MRHATKKTLCFSITACILIWSISQAFTEESTPRITDLAAQEPEFNENTKTVFFQLMPIECPREFASRTSRKITRKLRNVSYLELVTKRKSAFSRSKEKRLSRLRCYTKKCALKHAPQFDAERAIIGSVRVKKKQSLNQLGQDKGKQYLLVQKEKSWTTVKLTLIDVTSGDTIATFRERVSGTNTNQAIDRIIKKLQTYYQAKERPKPEPKPEPLPAPPVIERKIPYQLTLSGSAIHPFGTYTDTARFGLGMQGGILYPGTFFPNLVVGGTFSYHYMFPNDDDINSYNLLVMSGLAGYSFDISEKFSCAPLLGCGYHINHINEKNNTTGENKNNLYLDPHLQLQTMCNFRINAQYSLFITPGYTIFFEKSNNGQYFQIQAGMTWHKND